jgi:RHS repeat-associated protein
MSHLGFGPVKGESGMKTWRFVLGTFRGFLDSRCFLTLILIQSWPLSLDAADISAFSVFATNSAWIRYDASVNSGNIGARDASSGPWLNSHSEVTIGYNTYVADGVKVYADSLKIKPGGSLFDVYYNELNNKGCVRGTKYSPLHLPLDVSLPEFPIPAPGTKNCEIAFGDALILDPGAYCKIKVGRNATLILTGGTYHIESLSLALGGGSKVLFQTPTDLIINKRLGSSPSALIGPAPGSGISAKDIRIYVNGINGWSGRLYAVPKAAEVGFNNIIEANIYAPNGTIWIRPGTVAGGAFIGKDVRIGMNVQVNLNSGFGVVAEPTVTISADPETVEVGESSTLTWTSTDADTCTIEPDIGTVHPSGSTPVLPTETTTYTITASGAGGSATDTVTVNVNPPSLSVSITSPSDGEEFNQEPITVTGTVGLAGAAVSVNGIAASVVENEFMAEDVPLTVGPNTITALAEDGTHTAEDTITVFLMDIDLGLSQLQFISLSQDPQSLEVSGELTAAILNDGTGDVAVPYQMVLFEDIDHNGAYEAASDNLLGGTSIASGPAAQSAMDVSMAFAGELRFRDDPVYLFVDSANDLQETDETNNLFSSRPDGTDVTASLLTFSDTACPHLVTLTVRIGNSGGTAVDPGVSVAFYEGDPNTDGVLIGAVPTSQSLDPGHYEDLTFEWANASSGIINIYAQADDDGAGTGVLDEIDEENNTVTSEMGICAAPPTPGPEGISGIVMDAVTGSFLAGADVSLHQEENGEPGTLVSQYTTGDYGWFVFSGINSGSYLLRASTDGYITADRPLVLASGQTLTNQNLVLSPVLGPQEVRIVLTWGVTPEDLEAHLTGPNPEGCRHHCYYWNRDIPGANLDRDDRESYGPETITITQKTSGTYRYYVHDFTNKISLTSQALSLSTAQVKVYFGSGADTLDFPVPPQAGTVWHVFNLDGDTGEVTPVNRMTFQDDPGEIDFPVIRSEAVRNATWGEPYTYEVEAEDPDLDTLTYSLSEAPEGMSVDPTTGLIQWTPSGGQGGQHHVVLDVTDGRCGEDMQTFWIDVTYVPVVSFSVEPCSGFNPGGDITLTWATERAETVAISQGIGEVSSTGSLTIPSPASPVVYTLTAANGAGQTQRTAPQMPSVTFSASPMSIPPPGGMAILTWESQCAGRCEIQGIGPVDLSGSLDVTVNETTSFTLTATNGAGSVNRSLTISVSQPFCTKPDVTFTSTPLCEWSPGDPVTLGWHTQNPTCTTSCEIDQGIGQVELNGSLTVTPTESTTYTLTATGPAGSTVKTAQVPNLLSLWIYNLRANPDRLRPGKSATLIWSTQCADTCTIDQGIGDVDASGALTVTPADLPITYTLKATDGSGSITRSTTIQHAAPSVTFSVSPWNIKSGETATLTWSTEYATSCTIKPDIGNVNVNGSLEVAPEETTMYTLVAQGPGGTTSRQVTVRYVAPTAQILADPESVVLGQSSTLSWVFSNADTCTIDQGIGEVQLGETVDVTPTEATTYTITAVGPGGTATDSVTVTLLQPPSIALLQPDGVSDTADKVFLIKWSDEDADSNASVSLYYYEYVGEGGGGSEILIVSGLDEDPDGPGSDEYAWDTTAIPEGEYYLYAVIDDCVFDPIEDHSSGLVTIVHGLLDEVKITGTGASENDYFGQSVSISGDYAIVGAPYDHDAGTSSGSAYVFKREGTDWIEQAKLAASDVAAYDYFGSSVSISGDYVIVAATGDDDGGDSSGAAYIFKRDGTSWTEQAKLTASDAAAYDEFGNSVSISGDYAIVGGPYDDDSGSAYIFERDGTDWAQQAKLTASDPESGDNFGSSVSISGDYAIVGAHWDEDSGYESGVAYIFNREGSIWTQQAKLAASNASIGDHFGISVSISGDYAIVGKEVNYDFAEAGLPSAYVFKRDGSDWTEMAILTREGDPEWDSFGQSVAINGDCAIVGAYDYYNADQGSEAGAAYLFKREGSEWIEQTKYVARDAMEYDNFGYSVAISEAYAIVGAYGDDDSGSSSGSTYIYPYFTVAFSADPGLIGVGESSTLSWNSDLANSCSIEPGIGDVDVTGCINVSPSETTTYTVRAIGPDGIVSKSVTVVVIDPSVQPTVTLGADPETIPTGESCILSWTSTNASSCIIEPDVGSVDISGSVAVTPSEDTTYTITASNSSGTATDSVTVVVAPSITIIEPDGINDVAHTSFIIQWEDADNDDDAMISLYYSAYGIGQGGTLIASGLSEDPDGEGNDEHLWDTTDIAEGEYYVFGVIYDGKNDPTVHYGEGRVTVSHRLTSEVKLTANDGAESDNFGYSVSLSGDYTIVGAPYDDDNGSSSGAAYIFKSDGPAFAEQGKLTAGDGAASDNFGISVSVNGDYAIVGAPYDDDSGTSSGSAYIFKREGTDWIRQVKVTASDGASGDTFGISVSVSGYYAIVGAYQDDDGGYSAGAAYIFKREGTDWIEQIKLTASDSASYDSFGYSVSISGDYAIVGAYYDDDGGSNSGSAYVFKREGTDWFEQVKLTASDAAYNDYFGYSVSIGEDYAFVGAYQDDDGGSNAGSAYVFRREGTDWIEQTKLTASDAAAGDSFGRSVSMIGDYAIVGAYGDDDSGSSSGSAYIFLREGTDWNEEAKLTASDAADNDYFGYSVSIDENYAVVGAHQDDDIGSSSGSAYVYPFFTLSFSAEPALIEAGESCTLWWRSSLADSCSIEPDIGNVDLSGTINVYPSQTTTYTITAVGSDGVVSKSATVVVIDPTLLPSVTLSADPETILNGESCTLSWTSTNASSCTIEPDFGSVELSGSMTVTPGEDTTYTIAAGNSGGTATDSVTVIVTPTITILEPDGIDDLAHSSFVIQWDDGDNDDNAMISLYYDVDGSGEDGTFIVSGLSEDPDGEGHDEYLWDTTEVPEGDYYVYGVIDDGKNDPTIQYSQGTVTIAHSLSSEVKLTASDGATSDYFGISVSISGDYAVVGAYQGDGSVSNTGSAYVFRRDGPVLSEEIELTASDGSYQDSFGYSVSMSGDYAIVGAYKDDGVESDTGAAYVFMREGSGWLEQAKLSPGDVAYQDYFGYSVSISGDYAIVGAYGDDDGGSSSGAAYVFKREGTDWIEQAKLMASDAAASDYFGRAVAIGGDYAVVGAYRDDDRGTDSGSAYVFKRESTDWFEQAKLTASDGAAGDYFGWSVSISGDYVVTGAYKADGIESDTGAAYVFKRQGVEWIQETRLTASDGGASDYFGISVSIGGGYAIVGAYRDDDGGSDSGSAYLFKREDTDWVEEEKLTATDGEPGDYFGRAVAINWDAAIVGAYRDDDSGSESGSAYIYPIMGAAALTVGISADPDLIMAWESSTLTWTSENADTCSIEPDFGAVDLSGSTTVSPAETTTYTITATGSLGTVTDSVTVAVTYPVPVVSMSADPESIQIGDSATLTWDSTYADSCVIDRDIGSVDLSGSITVSPSETTTYTITATGSGGSAMESVTVTVIYPPTVSVGADPEIIQIGDTTTLTWDSENTDTCEIDQGIGSVDLSGSTTASPNETTTYTITATGPLSTATDSVTVTVTDPMPTVSISADPLSIQPGETSTLSWTSGNADSCTIEPGIGSVAVNGSIPVSPTETTTYTISVTGLGLTARSEVRIFVGDGNIYSCGDPTAAEQAHLEALNRARLDPAAEAARLGIDLNEGLPEGTISTTPVQPLTFNAQLYQAASLHSQDMIDQQYYSHDSLDGRTFSDRIAEAGYPCPMVGESLQMRAEDTPLDEVDVLLEFHDQLFVDQGIENRGNRLFMLSPDYKEVGFAAASGTCDGYPYCYKFTSDFGSSCHQLNGFLLGVVYDDQNGDGIYTAGEGIGDVDILIVESGASTITASAGGYGLVLPPGYYNVEATLPDGRQVTRAFTMTIQNEKIDFPLSEFELKPPTMMINGNPLFLQPGDSATLIWSSSHASTATIDNGIGDVPVNGSTIISPLETTTYTIRGTGPSGTVTDSVTVTVTEPFLTVNISADPTSIHFGESSTLSWTSRNADSCIIEPDIGSVSVNGSIAVSPAQTTTYTISATGLGVTAWDHVRIVVGDEDEYSYGDPTPAEQAHLEALNRARLDPSAEAERLGIDLNEGLPAGTISSSPAQPLTFNAQLHHAALLHSQDMIDQGYYSHNSLDGRTPYDRIAEAGYPCPLVGENIAACMDYAPIDEVGALLEFHNRIFLDAGVEGRGHRINMLSDGYKEVGLAAAIGTCEGYPYCYRFTCDFGSSSHQPNAFLLGVVYEDQNGDGIYTAGEGVGNVEILIVESGASTTTASAGGYGLPLSPGSYTVEASLPDGRLVTRAITMTAQNVKVDFLLSEFGFVLPSVLINASPLFIQPGDSATLNWSSSHASTATIDNGIGDVPVNGSTTVSLLETTTYTISASGPGGSVSDSITVYLGDDLPDAPSVTMTAAPASIPQGGAATLSWSSTNGQSAYIDHGIGHVAKSGSMTISPDYTTTYTVTVTNASGSASSRAKVTVMGNPASQPEGSFGETYESLTPVDATIDQYHPRRFSIITGLVHGIDDTPISDVSITILGHPEYGTALTDVGGRFSIPVEGGATMTVVYEKEGLITAQRKVCVPWNDIAIAKTIQMIGEDPISTTVVFDGNPDTVVTHRSSEVTDEFGSRACSMVFTGDNSAYVVDEDGNDIGELGTITTRATEFPTPESMPAILPPNSAFTHCVELSVDNAERIRFDKPVIIWIDNFLGFNVGSMVPVGYYDRDRGVWVPCQNGLVVKLLDTDTDGIVDSLDADGDDLADDLNNDGFFDTEVKGLGNPATYAPGDAFWRTELSHFTAVDHNWAASSTEGGTGDYLPNPDGEPYVDEQKKKPCLRTGCSYLEDRSRIFHEDIPIPGTDLTLHYASNRVEGYKQVITVPASGEDVPEGVKSIVVDVEVAGRTFSRNFPPEPNRIATFVWDGLDYLGNPVTGAIAASIFVGYSYDSVYWEAGDYERAFAQPGSKMTDIPAREDDIWWRKNGLLINMNKDTIAEGWTLSNHHQLSPLDPGTLLKGDGSIATTREVAAIHSLAGDGTLGFGGDGGPATDAWLSFPSDVAVDAEGNVYIADIYNNRIRKVDTDGIITTVAGTGDAGFSGDGGLATNAQLDWPIEVCVDAQGNLYIADFNNKRVRKVDTNGIITTVAGGGNTGVTRHDIPATDANIGSPDSLAVDASGNLYIGGEAPYRIYKVYEDHTVVLISHIAGAGGFQYDFDEQDGGPAIEATFFPSGLAVDASGNLYVGCINSQRVLKINKDGIITSIAGDGRRGYDGDGGPATEARFFDPVALALDALGNLYISDKWNYRIRRVDSSGIITTVAGNGTGGYMGDGEPAIAAGFVAMGIEFGASGALYLADYLNSRVRKVTLTPSAETSYTGDKDIIFPEEDGLGHRMNAAGHHESTFDLATGTTLYDFEYAVYKGGEENEDKRLVSIADHFGDQITIQRTSEGVPLWIDSPDGLRTTVMIDGNNHLTRITHPDGSFCGFEYTPDGLMTAKIEPEGNRFKHEFDENGRLTDATDQEGGHWQQSKTAYPDGNILAEVTSGAGVTSYMDHTDSAGKYTSTITDPTGGETLFAESADGLSVDKSLPCGMDFNFEYDVEPRYQLKYLSKVSETTPSSLGRVSFINRTYQPADPDAPPELATETVTVNGKATTSENNVSQSFKTITSPEGRTVAIDYDPNTLLTTKLSIPGLHDTDYGYDGRGRVTSVTTNARETSFSYTPQGFLESVTDPEDHTTTYTHDAVGRVTEISRPDGSSIGFTYDENGNMTVLTNPSTIDHGFEYNKVNLNSLYQTPLSGSYTYVYDNDRRLVQTTFPSGAQINNIYSTTRLMQIQAPEGNIDLTYACGTKVGSITNGTETITYAYDGKLLTSEALSGTLNQSLSYTYNNDFNLESVTYAGDTCFYSYDDDGLLTNAGGYTISRNGQNGLPEAVVLYGAEEPVLHLSRAFNGYGELEDQEFTISDSSLTSWNLTRDNAGRITKKTETVEGITSDYTYTYDSMGRLLTVTKDSTLVEEYDYDANGARIYEMNALRGITGRTFDYSDEDHLLTTGDATYQYDVDGFLATKTQGTDVTTYEYSSRGELLSVSLPDGAFVEYVHDPLGRRIAKKVDGVITEKYLWQGRTRLLAVYDESDNLLMRFEYADGRMPAAMTKDGSTYYLAYDQVGSLKVVAEESGNVVKRMEYDSFGNILNDTNPLFEMPFSFAGGLHDRDTGLLRFGFRDYDPDVGRWTAKDPILFAGGDTDLYGYCLSDPLSLPDPSGLSGAHQYTVSAFGSENAGIFNFKAKTETDFRAGTARSGIEGSVGQLRWTGDRGCLSGSANVYHWHGQLKGGMTNVYSLGGLEASAKIAAYEGKARGLVQIGSIYFEGILGGTLGSLGAEGKIGTRGVKIGLHALLGFLVGFEWGFVSDLPCN